MSLKSIATFDSVTESPAAAGETVWFERSTMNAETDGRYYVQRGDMVCSSREEAMSNFPRSIKTTLPSSATITWMGPDKRIGILETLGSGYVRWNSTE
jgi:hypothetical protein